MAALLEQARSESPVPACELLTEALALWRGPVLADLEADRFAPEHVVRFDALRRAVREERVDGVPRGWTARRSDR